MKQANLGLAPFPSALSTWPLFPHLFEPVGDGAPALSSNPLRKRSCTGFLRIAEMTETSWKDKAFCLH